MLATMPPLLSHTLILGVALFLAVIFGMGVFFVLSLLLVPFAALRGNVRRLFRRVLGKDASRLN